MVGEGGGLRRSWQRVLAALYGRLPLLPALAARKWKSDDSGEVPWSPAQVRLPEASVALVTSAGVHLNGDSPFDMANPEGDATFRVIPGDAALRDLTITHDYYDHRAADRDLNCVFPLERLHELARAGRIGRVAPRHIGTMGHILGAEERRLVAETAPAIARLLVQDEVDYVLATPG
ncbi:MAG: glycine/sarcosine/betaine reductase selenoprotein B family protein [Gemmatimonadales bacterium]